MTKAAVADWSTTAASNTDIGGVNIAENCPAAGMNNALRELMAQIATYVAGTIAGLLPKSGGTMTGAITAMSTGSTVKDGAGTERYVGYRNIPLRAATSQQTLALTDVGTMIANTTGGWVVPLNATVAFTLGDAVSGYNNSGSSQSITAAVGVTLRLHGSASTGTRTVVLRGFWTVVKVGTDEWVALGDVS